MVKKIISGGQSGAGRAAMDFALEVGIPCGGAVLHHDGGIVGEGCNPPQTQTHVPFDGMGQNVIDSHGTLIISHGELRGPAFRTKKLADRLHRPSLQIDLSRTNGFVAAAKIIRWIVAHGIEILNIDGQGPRIYRETLRVLKGSYYMAALNQEMSGTRRTSRPLPGTIEEALESLSASMSLKEKTRLARMEEGELIFFHPALAAYTRERFGLSAGNRPLITACRQASGAKDLDEDGASSLIIRRLCEKLKSTHSLRVVARGKDCS